MMEVCGHSQFLSVRLNYTAFLSSFVAGPRLNHQPSQAK